MPCSLEELTIQVSSKRIGFMRFILEAYDGLAILSTTMDQGSGNIVLRFHPGRRDELLGLLSSLRSSLII